MNTVEPNPEEMAKEMAKDFVKMMGELKSRISGSENWDLKDIMSVQPMDRPCGAVFYMDYKYDFDKAAKEEFEYAKKKLLDKYNSEKVHEPIKDLDSSNVKEQRYISDDGTLVIYRYDNGGWYCLAGRAGFVLFERGIPVGYVGTRMS